MKLQAIEAFLAIVETGSIRSGARKIGLSQPAMSKVLRALEEELGVGLLTRGVKGVELTEFGRLFYHRAAAIQNESLKAREEIQQLLGHAGGSVSIAMAPAAALKVAPLVLTDFFKSMPGTRLHFYEGLQTFAVDNLRTGMLDLAICPVFSPISEREFVVTPLFDTSLKVVARKDSPYDQVSSLEELQEARWVNIVSGASVSPLINEAYLSKGLPAPKKVVECYSFSSALPLVLKSDMLGLFPDEWVSVPGISADLSVLSIDDLPVNRLNLIYRRDQPLTPIAQHMATLILRLAEL